MDQTWNDFNLKPPPFVTLPHDRICLLKGLTGTEEACHNITKALQQLQDCDRLECEMFILARLVYKIRNNIGGQKVAKGLSMVKKCLQRWKTVAIKEVLKPLKEDLTLLCSVTTSSVVYIQSALCMKYILHRLMGTAALLGQTASYCMHTFICAYQNLLLALFVPKMLTFMALTSRIRVLSLSLMQPLFVCYKHARQLLLDVYPAEHVDDFPDDLELWVKDQGYCSSLTSHLEAKMAESSHSLDMFLSKYIANPEAEDDMDGLDSLNKSKTLNTAADVSQLMAHLGGSNQNEEKPEVSECMVTSTVAEFNTDTGDLVSLGEDLGETVPRETISCPDGDSNECPCKPRSDVQHLTDVISDLPSCMSLKHLLSLLKRIEACVPNSRMKYYKGLKQQLQAKLRKQSRAGGKEMMSKCDVAAIRKKIARFLQRTVETLDKVMSVDYRMNEPDIRLDLAVGKVQQEGKALQREVQLHKASCLPEKDKDAQDLEQPKYLRLQVDRYSKLKKLLKVTTRKKQKSKKILEVLLQVKSEARRYKPEAYKKIVRDIRLNKDVDQVKLQSQVETLLREITTAMDDDLKEREALLQAAIRRCKGVRAKLTKGCPVSDVAEQVGLLAEVAGRCMPGKYAELTRELADGVDGHHSSEFRSLLLNFVQMFKKDCLLIQDAGGTGSVSVQIADGCDGKVQSECSTTRSQKKRKKLPKNKAAKKKK